MPFANNVHTYLVRFYDSEQLAQDPKVRTFSKSKTTRATSATRAISNVFRELLADGGSRADYLVLEAKVVSG